MTTTTMAAALLLMMAAAATARAQSLVQVVPDDPCEQARALEEDDDSPTAEHLRRACRLRRFDDRLAYERRQEVIAAEQVRSGRIQRWLDDTQPARVTRPFSIDGFAGTGFASYGLSAAWAFLRKAELSAWFGRRAISCATLSSPDGGDCTRTAWGFRGRWYLLANRISPFLGAGMTITSSHLQIVQDGSNGGSALLSGSGRANSYTLDAGAQLAYAAFRLSVEYQYEKAYYTGASGDDPKKIPSAALNSVWSNSLNDDRHGVRVQVGFAF